MSERPQADYPGLSPVPIEGAPSLEFCTLCRYWQEEKMMKTPHGLAAPCRRYPNTAVLSTQIQPGPRGPQPVQVPGGIQTLMLGTEWCGEFRLRVRA